MASVEEKPHTRRASRLILLSVCIGQIIVGLDLRAITVALPTLTTGLTPMTRFQQRATRPSRRAISGCSAVTG